MRGSRGIGLALLIAILSTTGLSILSTQASAECPPKCENSGPP